MDRRIYLPLIFLAAALSLAGLLLWQTRSPVSNAARPTPASPALPPRPAPALDSVSAPAHPSIPEVSLPSPPDAPAAVRDWLEVLDSRLAALPSDQAARLLQQLLRSGADRGTGREFALGPDGNLSSAPTIRTWALDRLTRVDPAAAVTEAQTILDTPESADEWAVALRAYALGKPGADSTAYLQSKARQMLHHAPWLQSPSVGFLEAFDVFVFTRDTAAVPDLSALLRQTEDRGLAHAAFLTLDRLVFVSPEATLQQWVESPELLAGREPTRGNHVARADLSDPRQRQLVETYLLDRSRTPRELQAFFGTFPNANFMVSHNLLTQSPGLAGDELRRRDLAAAQVVERWAADPRFERLQSFLQPMKKRLDGFVSQHHEAP